MRRSTERILTTHAGSLPRPEHLTSLFVRRSRGEGVAADEIAAAGRAALRAIVPRQAEAGIDVGNNGEQQRDSFFLYLKERLTGLGGTWQRPSRADVDQGARVAQRRFADGGRRGALYRYGCHRGGVQRLRRRPQGSSGYLCRTVHERAVARYCRRRDQERALRH